MEKSHLTGQRIYANLKANLDEKLRCDQTEEESKTDHLWCPTKLPGSYGSLTHKGGPFRHREDSKGPPESLTSLCGTLSRPQPEDPESLKPVYNKKMGLIQLWHHRRRKSHSLQTRMRWVNAFQHDQLQFSADHKLQPPGMTLHQTNAPSSDNQQVLMLNHPVATRGSAADLYHLVTPRIDDTFSECHKSHQPLPNGIWEEFLATNWTNRDPAVTSHWDSHPDMWHYSQTQHEVCSESHHDAGYTKFFHQMAIHLVGQLRQIHCLTCLW